MRFYITILVSILYEERLLPDIVEYYEKAGIKGNLVNPVKVTRRQYDEGR
jgi:hypothetical protein